MADMHMPDDGKSTGKVIWHVAMSLNRFIAGLHDNMERVIKYGGESDSMAQETIRMTGAILASRRWYDLAMSRLGRTAGNYGGAWMGPVFVLTHQPPSTWDNPAITPPFRMGWRTPLLPRCGPRGAGM